MAGLFPLGQIAATPGALAALTGAGMSPTELLSRHQAGDWGTVPAEDAAENEHSLTEGARLVSSYPVGAGRVWIITEWDRTLTTLLLPSEY